MRMDRARALTRVVAICGTVWCGFGTAAAQGVEDPWGPSNRGVRIRARAEKKIWSPSEPPQVALDLSIGSVNSIAVARMPASEVEIDGVWYVSRVGQPVAGYVQIHGGSTRARYTAVRLDDNWIVRPADYKHGRPAADSNTAKRLTLSSGRHAIRVSCRVDGRDPISNLVEIEVAGK